MEELQADIILVSDLLKQRKVQIPEYQRPYKWQAHQVTALVQDIMQHAPKAPYRLGTIVFHRHDDVQDIVDGQQRFTTLKLIIFAFAELTGVTGKEPTIKCSEVIRKNITEIYNYLKQHHWKYNHSLSIKNISNNYQLLLRLLRSWNDEEILLLLQNTQVVVFYLNNITEAFQFFDSQNARGKDLDPHDLLKAYHLREFEEVDQQRKTSIVDRWESIESKKLSNLFARNLYRVKQWMAGKPAKVAFIKDDVHLFKGVTLTKIDHYPYVKALLISHHFTDRYNQDLDRNIDKQHYDFPFQLDQVMINGRRFFEYVDYYQSIKDYILKLNSNENFTQYQLLDEKNQLVQTNLITLLFKNSKSYREGEQFIANLFGCLMMCFIDKFGTSDLEKFAEKAFVWAFCLRFEYSQLKFISLDNYVLRYNLFITIKEAIHVEEVLSYPIKMLPNINKESWSSFKERIDVRVVNFFKENHYYVQQ